VSAPERRYPAFVRLPPGITDDPTQDYRARVQAELAATAHRRRVELAEQCSAANAPTMRIRIWERLHMTRLPGEPDHCLVPLIALQTGLTVSQVQAEQQRRDTGG